MPAQQQAGTILKHSNPVRGETMATSIGMPDRIVATNASIRPFSVNISEDDLAYLRSRLASTRLPSKELVPDQSQGVQLATIQALAKYWATEYDMRRLEDRLNALPQYKIEIDGLDIHFIHVRS